MPDTWWPDYNSSISDYEERFFSRVLEGHTIQDLLSDIEKPVVVDLLSSTSALRSLFSNMPNKDTFGIAVSSQDLRTPEEIAVDKSLGITQISGGLTTSKSLKEVEKALAGRKADLILERGGLGVDFLPFHPMFYAVNMQRIWNMLNSENGIILMPCSKTTSRSN